MKKISGGADAYENSRFHDFSDLNEERKVTGDSISPKERRKRFLKVGIIIAILAVLSPLAIGTGSVFMSIVLASVLSVVAILMESKV
ncbi:MAG: hypothetical protein V8S27_05025 [Lachnospiraceae bacterium]